MERRITSLSCAVVCSGATHRFRVDRPRRGGSEVFAGELRIQGRPHVLGQSSKLDFSFPSTKRVKSGSSGKSLIRISHCDASTRARNGRSGSLVFSHRTRDCKGSRVGWGPAWLMTVLCLSSYIHFDLPCLAYRVYSFLRDLRSTLRFVLPADAINFSYNLSPEIPSWANLTTNCSRSGPSGFPYLA